MRVAIVTGASAGIGRSAARELVASGWRVFGIGRHPERTKVAAEEIASAARGGGKCEMLHADLAILSDVARVAGEIADRTDRIDLLLANAGGVARERHVTPEGNEGTFAGNHLGHFMLVDRLLPRLKAAARTAPSGSVRIISTTSDASEMTSGFDWNDLQLLNAFEPGHAYRNAKLANVLFVRGLASRLSDTGIVAHAQHPGTVASNFGSHAPARMQAYMETLSFISSDEAGANLVWLATAHEPGGISGRYYHGRAPHAPNPLADDPAVVDRLWFESEALIERSGGHPGSPATAVENAR